MSGAPRTMSVALTWPFQRVYVRLGADPRELAAGLQRYGVPLEDFADAAARIPTTLALDELENYSQSLGHTELGILAAEATLPGDFGLLELAARACSTTREALEVLARGYELLADGMHLTVEPRGDRVALRFSTDPGYSLPPAAVEFALLSLYRIGRGYARAGLRATAVRFAHPRVPHFQLCEDAFGCSVQFDAPEHALDLSADQLELPLSSSSPMTAELMRARVDALTSAPRGDDLVHRLEAAITKDLAAGVPKLSVVARELGVSERTVHRKLRNLGTSYRRVCDELRLRLALHYLERSRMPIKQIASALGYGDAHAFHRSFKRMTGSTPQQRRRQALAPAPGED